MKTMLGYSLIAVAFALPLVAYSAGPQSTIGDSPSASNVSAEAVADYFGQRELLRRELSYALAPIKSSNDLESYLYDTAQSFSPLDRLSPSGKRRFLESLTFTERGLASYDFADLEAELSVTEIYQVLSLFGAQHTTPMIKGARVASDTDNAIISLVGPPLCVSLGCEGDRQASKCISPGTCQASSTSFICTSNC